MLSNAPLIRYGYMSVADLAAPAEPDLTWNMSVALLEEIPDYHMARDNVKPRKISIGIMPCMLTVVFDLWRST